MTSINETSLAGPADIAAFLGVPIKTLYAWRHAAKGPRSIRVGKHLRYRWEDVSVWLEEQCDGSPDRAA